MTTEIATANEAGEDAALREVFRHMPEPFALAVIDSALKFRSRASKNACDALNAAIKASGLRVPGFRDASRANSQQLGPLALDAIAAGDYRLPGALLRIWQETQPALREQMAQLLRDQGHDTANPDYKRGYLRDVWESEAWDELLQEAASLKATAALKAEATGEQAFEEAQLMLVLTSAKAPAVEPNAAVALRAPLFQRWAAQLEALPADAPEWDDAENFIAAVARLVRRKQDLLIMGYLAQLQDAIDQVREAYADELRYLEIDLDGWFDAALGRPDQREQAEALIEELVRQLKGYQPVRAQGASLDDERRRARARTRWENAILRIVAEWSEAMAPREETCMEADDASAAIEGGSAAAPAAIDATQRPPNETPDGNMSHLEAEIARLAEENEGAENDKALLREQVSELRGQLREITEAREQWRHAYIQERERTETQREPPSPPASLMEAIERAKASFADELIFALNSKSNKNAPFRRPQEVFNALAWLATEFRRLRTQPQDHQDFDKSIRESCSGWFYAPHQSEVTMGQFPEWYQATVDGKLYKLCSHIGSGTGRDAQHIIRIAFAWDEAKRCAVVGYIGPHQRNGNS